MTPREEQLFQKYRPLVQGIVGRLTYMIPKTWTRDDCLQEGYRVLLHAVQRCRPTHPRAEQRFLFLTVRGGIICAIRKQSPIRRRRLKKYQQARQRVLEAASQSRFRLSKHECEAAAGELAPYLYFKQVIFRDPDEVFFKNTIDTRGERHLDQVEARDTIGWFRQHGTAAQWRVLEMLYWQHLTPNEIASRLGCTRQDVYGLHHRAIQKFQQVARFST